MIQDMPTYEKSIESIVTRTTHTVRIALNSDRESIEQTLKHVPYNAVVTMVVGDDDIGDNWGEIIFVEERQSE